MIIQSVRELENTRRKLRLLEDEYEVILREPGGNQEMREVELQSLKGLINQFKEEIARFEARTTESAKPR